MFANNKISFLHPTEYGICSIKYRPQINELHFRAEILIKGSCYGIYSDNKIKRQTYYLLLYRHKCFTGKYTTRKIHKNYIQDPSGVFSIISHVSLSIFSLISSVLNCTEIHWCIIETSSGLPLKSSTIFGHLRKLSENVRERSSGLRYNCRKFSEIFGKWSEIFGKSSKTPSSACLYYKKNITWRLEDINFIFSWQKQYFTRCARS